MSKEEKRAIEIYKQAIEDVSKNGAINMTIEEFIIYTPVLINLIQKQQKEIEKKDKIIDEMAKSIVHNNDIDYEICENVHEQEIECEGYSRETNESCEKCVKQYFEKKVEGE